MAALNYYARCLAQRTQFLEDWQDFQGDCGSCDSLAKHGADETYNRQCWTNCEVCFPSGNCFQLVEQYASYYQNQLGTFSYDATFTQGPNAGESWSFRTTNGPNFDDCNFWKSSAAGNPTPNGPFTCQTCQVTETGSIQADCDNVPGGDTALVDLLSSDAAARTTGPCTGNARVAPDDLTCHKYITGLPGELETQTCGGRDSCGGFSDPVCVTYETYNSYTGSRASYGTCHCAHTGCGLIEDTELGASTEVTFCESCSTPNCNPVNSSSHSMKPFKMTLVMVVVGTASTWFIF